VDAAYRTVSRHVFATPIRRTGDFELAEEGEHFDDGIVQRPARETGCGRGGKRSRKGVDMQKFTLCLWFDSKAEEAVRFYTSVFKDSKIKGIAHYGKAGAEAAGKPEGTVMTVSFQLNGQDFLALNGGPEFTFSPAMSIIANCDTQEEIDELWQKLSEGGEEIECGWLKDKYGVAWQIVPTVLSEMMSDEDPARSERVMKALLQMKKLDIEILKRAYA
jgi:predicted 3-demethylubiquinone-9 3-methyltransferase (glyoxalase superfamily)